MSSTLTLLWIDLRVDDMSMTIREPLRQFFRVREFGYPESIGVELRTRPPDALMLDFDYPDRSGLRVLQELKAKYPSMPIVMATVQHSEELAVWAFRSGVLDFFVKPAPEDDLRRTAVRLQKICDYKRRQKSRDSTLVASGLPLEAAPGQSSDLRALAPALHYVAQNYREKIRRDEAAGLCAMTPFQFSRRFRDACGIPFRDFVVRHRIREACRLLDNPTASITSVAFAVGFNDVGYFSRMFKQYMGITPSALQNQLQRPGATAAKLRAHGVLDSGAVDDTGQRLQALPPLPPV